MNPFTLFQDFLGSILAFFYDVIPSYGLAIIFLTLLVSLLLFPLTLKQTRSMKAMQEIQPEVKRLQKEYKEDREEMQKQLMALYQERGVNPAAGCLPLLLQMPIWFALYGVLRVGYDDSGWPNHLPEGSALGTAIKEDVGTGFLGMDLLISPSEAFSQGITEAIPYIILVLIVVGAGFYQQMQISRRNKTNGQAQAQPAGMQTAMKIMPLFFGFISWGFPAGLVLYFATSNLFRVGQQAVIFSLDGREHTDADVGPDTSDTARGLASGSNGDTAPPEAPKGDGPSPNASKKRKKRRRK